MVKKRNPHLGSTLDSFLEDEGIREEVEALRFTRDTEEIARVADRLAAIAPLELDTQLLRMQRKGAAGKAAEFAAEARAVLDAHPDDPRAAILEACARAAASDLPADVVAAALADDLARIVGLDPAQP